MNKLLKREFLPSTEPNRKRWFATMNCQRCGEVFTVLERSGSMHLKKPCQTCSLAITAYNSFIRKAFEKHGDRFSYRHITADNYVNAFTLVTITCKVHGDFQQKPKDHISKTNGKLCCPLCIYEFNCSHNKRSIESWKNELKNKFPKMYMIQHGNADSNTEKCTIMCPEHGRFETTLAGIKTAVYLCPLCAQDNNSWGGRFRRVDIKGFLYLISIPSIGMWKLGVTSTTPQKRLRSLELPYSLEWCIEFPTLADAYKEESRLFKKYKNFRRNRNEPPVLGRCKGNTELMLCDIPVTAIQCSDTLSKES